jgi:putative peptidoglycan lipid II flippase
MADTLIPDRVARRGRTVSVVGVLTVTVAIFGYLREAALAARFGVSTSMDAYFGAIFIPSMLYLILITGTLSPIFIPILLQESHTNDRQKISETFSVITTFALVTLTIAVLCGMATARLWLPWLFSGYGPVTMELTLRLTYIIFPAVLFLAVAGILTAVLNGFHKFALPAFAPAIASIIVIVSIVAARGSNAIYTVSIATAIGFLLQCLVLVPATAALGLNFRPSLNWKHPAVGKLLRLGVPLLLYLAVANASSFVERNLASKISAGAVSALTYSLRVFAMPVNFLAVPLATVAYPQFAKEAAREGHGELGQQVSRILRFIIFLFLPISTWMVLNALPLTRVLYEHGRFLPQDAYLTSRVLMFYSIGMLPNAAAIVLLRCFFAVQDTVTPLIAELLDLVYYVTTATILTRHFGLMGLAIARGGAFFVVAFILIFFAWKRRELLKLDAELLWFFVRAAIASVAMGFVSWASLHLLLPAFHSGGTLLRLALMGTVLALSAATFLIASLLLKLSEAQQVLHTAWDLLSRPPGIGLQKAR